MAARPSSVLRLSGRLAARTVRQREYRSITSSAITSTSTSTSTPTFAFTNQPLYCHPRAYHLINHSRLSTTQVSQRRWHTAPPTNSKVYDFDAIHAITTSTQPSRLLIDVREPHEYAQGHIPTAVNMPLNSSPDGIFLKDDEFEEKYGWVKPASEQEVVFYCKSGVRSSAAARLAEQAGYENVGEYRGSWLDWEKNGGERAE